MKKYLTLSLLTLALVGQSCQGFLDENPQNFIAPTNFYKSAADALASVNAVYDKLSNWGTFDRQIYLLTELSTDNMDLIGSNQERVQIDNYQMDANNSVFRDAWQDLYQGVTRANITIDRVPGIGAMDAKLRDRIVGEARFLRAFYYYNLVRLWGDVPLITKEVASLEGLNVPRDPVEKVYAQIVADLQYAEQNLPLKYTGADVGRATSGAAKTLLTSVYLTRKQWGAGGRQGPGSHRLEGLPASRQLRRQLRHPAQERQGVHFRGPGPGQHRRQRPEPDVHQLRPLPRQRVRAAGLRRLRPHAGTLQQLRAGRHPQGALSHRAKRQETPAPAVQQIRGPPPGPKTTTATTGPTCATPTCC